MKMFALVIAALLPGLSIAAAPQSASTTKAAATSQTASAKTAKAAAKSQTASAKKAVTAAKPESESKPAGSGKAVGNPAAPLRMDLYSDFTCPHCKLLHEQILSRIMTEYVSPGKAYLVFHEFTLTGPGHEHSKPASLYAAAAARIGKYQAVSDVLYRDQMSWAMTGKVWETVAPVLSPAEQKKVQTLFNDPSIAAEVQNDLSLGIAAHVDRTPTIIMTRKGKQTPWFVWTDYSLFKSMVDLLLSK
jgi:protein-disulfide isomerase